MGLKIKSFQEILRGMVDWTTMYSKKLTDFHVGSAVRTLLEAIASELEQFYYSMYKNINWAIENAIFKSFGFERRNAISSRGDLTITFSYPLAENLKVTKGTRFATANRADAENLYFETEKDYIIKAGSIEAVIEVVCTKPGFIGNIGVDAIKLMVNPVPYVSEIGNKKAFTSGAEVESLAERKQRFNRYIETLARGTVSSLEYGTKEVEGITGVWVDDRKIGIVRVYAHDANGNLPTSLKDKVIKNLENYRAAGIEVEVHPIEKVEIDLDIVITVLQESNNEEFQATVYNNVMQYMNSFPVSKEFILAELNQLIMNIDDVAVLNVKIKSPASDITVSPQTIIRPREVRIVLQDTEMLS